MSNLEQHCSMVSASVPEVLACDSPQCWTETRRVKHIIHPPCFSEAAFGQSVLSCKSNKNKHVLINYMK